MGLNEQFFSLVLFAVAMTFSPGSNNVLMATSGVQVGMRRSVTLGLGVMVGMAGMLAVSAMGLGAVIHANPHVQVAMKAVGSAYLVWLAWKIATAGSISFESGERPVRYGFMAGFTNALLNPKGWTMAFSSAVGYAALAPSAPQLAALLAGVFAVVLVPDWVLWCGGGQALARSLRTERHWQVANAVLGALVVVSIVPMWLE